jgi:[2Fe-2S] binding domain
VPCDLSAKPFFCSFGGSVGNFAGGASRHQQRSSVERTCLILCRKCSYDEVPDTPQGTRPLPCSVPLPAQGGGLPSNSYIHVISRMKPPRSIISRIASRETAKKESRLLRTGGASYRRAAPAAAGFIDHDAFQCGYCTPGQICSAAGLIAEGRARGASIDDIRELTSGNICRCGAYRNIVAAIPQAMGQS